MKPLKVTEIKVTLGKDVVILAPAACTCTFMGKTTALPPPLAAHLFKAVAAPCEQMMQQLRDYKP